MAENPERHGKRFGIFFGILMILCAVVGYKFGPYVYEYIDQWRIYTVVANCRSAFYMLGATVFDVILILISVVGKAAGKIWSIESRYVRRFVIVALAVLCLIAAWAHFAEGVAISKSVEKSTQYQKGEIKDLCELESDIYVNIVTEDGRAPRDPDFRYEIIDVERTELPQEIILLDFPRYFACQTFGAGPIKVTVKPRYPDVIVRFADPLVSLGDETIVKKHDPDLLGSAPAEDQVDYSPVFKYRFAGTGEICLCTIRGVENTLEMQEKIVQLWWDNEWELSCRDVLNHQNKFAEAGDTVDFYYPGERIVFDLDMIQNSESPDRTLSEKLRGAEWYELSLELVNAEIVRCDETVTDRAISSSGLPEQPECMVKTGPDIVYHCWAGEDDLGRYCIATCDGAVKWEVAPEEKSAVVLRLDIG